MGRKMWFGTEEWMQWIDVPYSGADVSPQGSGASGVLIGGGGYALPARGSHKVYNFSWGNAAAIEAAELLQAYASGAYGNGLLYFHDPLTYRTNILPAQWAQPSLALEYDAPWLVPGVEPLAAPTPSWQAKRLPVRSAKYDITAEPGDLRESLFIPVPPGFTLRLGAFYSYTGSGGVYVAPVNSAGATGSPTRVTPTSPTGEDTTPATIIPGAIGVRLWVGRTSVDTSSVTLSALIARLIPGGVPLLGNEITGPWVAGQGHSGCRIDGRPTRVEISGVNGGQVGYAATLREVGSWER